MTLDDRFTHFAAEAEQTAERHRALQHAVGQEQTAPDEDAVPQTGARPYPVPPLPDQTLDKPGQEADLELQPMYDAPYYKGSDKLKDKVAIITGGDSGIGRAVAVLFAREGADVAIVYLNEHEDAEKTRALIEAEGRRALLFCGDVTNRDFCFAAVDAIVEAFGKLDVLVNNAAFQMHEMQFEKLSPEHLDTTLKTNLYGYVYTTQAALRHMQAGAAIVNSGSITGIEGSKSIVDYSMTKGGIHAFTRALSGQLLAKSIRVNAVAPGPVWTPLNPAEKPSKEVEQFGAQTPMKRPAQPEELAPAYVFLASNHCSSYITGEVLPVIGGY